LDSSAAAAAAADEDEDVGLFSDLLTLFS